MYVLLVLGVSIVRYMANHKLSRLHYVRATVEDAKYTAEANHSDKKEWTYGVEEVDGILSILREDMQILNSSITGTSLVRFRSVLTDYRM